MTGGKTQSKKVQSILVLPSNFKKTTCPTCEMTYSPNIPQDKSVHDKYHANFVNGLPWVTSNDTNVSVLETFTVVDRKVEKSTGKLKSQTTRQSYKCSIVSINKANKKHIQKIEKLLVMVNQELNASEDSGQWKNPKFDKSKAFVLIIDNKAVGLCTTDTIEGDQGRWMIYKSQTVVPKQINKNVIIGISRIWVSSKWRQHGLGKRLLTAVLNHSIYGVTLSVTQVAFSQPSFSGRILAKSFNGAKHKSGEVLIPVYIE